MTQDELTRYELRAHMFKAMAHPMRLCLLERLRDRPWCVCELAEDVGIDKSVASKHLTQLKEAGLIGDEKRGTQVEYRLIAPCVLDLAACAEGAVLMNRKRRLGLTEA
jgi:ArsR family transcriptional regulator